MTGKPTVLVIDDDAATRQSLQELLTSDDIQVKAYATPQELLLQLDVETRGCLILGVQMGEIAGLEWLEFVKRLRGRGSIHPFLFISDDADIAMAVKMMRHGAADFFVKPLDHDRLLRRVEQLLELDAEQRCRRAELQRMQTLVDSLTPRQREVMELVARGERNKQIARRLGISEKTVEIHRGHLTRKLQVRSIVELVKLLSQLDQHKPLK